MPIDERLNCQYIETDNGGLDFHFFNNNARVIVERISTNGRQGAYYGEITVEYPVNSPVITGTRECLTDGSERRKVIYNLSKLAVDNGQLYIPWDQFIDFAFSEAIKHVRRGPQISEVVVTSTDAPEPVQFDVFPLLQTEAPTTLFGDGGTLKSYLALFLAVAYRFPDWPMGLGITVESKAAKNVIWLDYETTEKDFRNRLTRIIKGHDLEFSNMYYVHRETPLADDIRDIRDEINALNPGLIVVDSIGAACAGDLNGSEAPTRFFNALRQLLGTKLLLFHTNKNSELYGNRFFWNFSRQVWEVKKQQTEGENMVSVGLFHRKANETKLFNPLGFEFNFSNEADTTIVKRADVADIPELEKALPLKTRMKALLLHRTMTVADIAAELQANEDSIRAILNREKNYFIKIGNEWGVKHNSVT